MISVIVPVYNQENYLAKCVDSILASTYKDFECILIDDGSKDKSPEICDEYAKKDSRIKVIHKLNGGLTSARVAGFEVVQGEYLCFVDSDDYIGSDMLQRLYDVITKENADVVTCGHYQDFDGRIVEDTFTYFDDVIEQKDMINKYVLPIIGKIYAPGFINYPGYVWGRLYRTSCVTEKCFVSEREVYTEDDLFQMFFAENAKKAVFINDKLCYYRENENSLTHVYRKNMWGMLKKRHSYVESFFETHKKDRDDVRIFGSVFYTIYVSISNAYGLTDKKAFVNEVKEIREDKFSDDFINQIDNKLLRPRQKLLCFLLKHKMYGLLFKCKNLVF